ncbi:unnamed protein product [Caenorhabditis brenneri]
MEDVDPEYMIAENLSFVNNTNVKTSMMQFQPKSIDRIVGRNIINTGYSQECNILNSEDFWEQVNAHYDSNGDDVSDLGFDVLSETIRRTSDMSLEKEEPKVERANLEGVGQLLKQLRGEYRPPQKERIVLDGMGRRFRDISKFPVTRLEEFQQIFSLNGSQEGIDFNIPKFPTDVTVVRQMFRQKMIRCKACKNRFIEKFIYEHHLEQHHPDLHKQYMQELEESIEEQRQRDIEMRHIEELESGGFIPPESEISQPSGNPNLIPLPGENSNGYIPRFNQYGKVLAKRPFVKKISPQCPFCDKRFSNEMSLKKHFLKKHENVTDIRQCLKCFKSAGNAAEMAAHDCELTYVCFSCTPLRNLCTETRLVNHYRKFHRGKNSGFHCDQCQQKFLTPRKLRRHKKMNHVFTKNIRCHFCEEYFISEVAVMTHERIHTGIIKFECKVCDFRANRYVTMEEHMKHDHGCVCAICHERFAEYDEMRHHVYMEHGGYMAVDEPIGKAEESKTLLEICNCSVYRVSSDVDALQRRLRRHQNPAASLCRFLFGMAAAPLPSALTTFPIFYVYLFAPMLSNLILLDKPFFHRQGRRDGGGHPTFIFSFHVPILDLRFSFSPRCCFKPPLLTLSDSSGILLVSFSVFAC